MNFALSEEQEFFKKSSGLVCSLDQCLFKLGLDIPGEQAPQGSTPENGCQQRIQEKGVRPHDFHAIRLSIVVSVDHPVIFGIRPKRVIREH